VTEAGRQNVPIKEAMGLTGHRSLVTFMRYFQTGAILQTRAANLFSSSVASTSSSGSIGESLKSETSR
jgi:hypothetical protein